MFLTRMIRFAPDDGQGSGNPGDNSGSGGDEDNAIARGIERLLARNGNDANAALLMLYQDNYQLREANRQLKAKLPPEGAVVLTGDDAAAWQTYKQLGAPTDLQKALQERDQAQGDLAKLRRSAMLREAAEAAGFKYSVLEALDATQGGTLTYEVREVEQDGKRAKVAHVKTGEAEAVPLTQYAQQQWADFLPALQAAPPPPSGTPWPQQQQGGKPPATDLVAQFQQEQEEANKRHKNPLHKE